MDNIENVIEIFKKAQPHRRPVKYARAGKRWYIYTTSNDLKISTLVENGWYYVEDGIVLPVTPLDMPKEINLKQVPVRLR